MFRSGARPWYPFDSHYDPKWDFSYGDISEAYDQMMMYAGPDEWRKMFNASRFFCFKCDGFKIVQKTDTMGLGTVSKQLSCIPPIFLLRVLFMMKAFMLLAKLRWKFCQPIWLVSWSSFHSIIFANCRVSITSPCILSISRIQRW